MKKVKLLLSAFAVLAIVGTTLAFKANSYFGQGTVYCSNTCSPSSLVNYTPGTGQGQTNAPCGVNFQGTPLPVYAYWGIPPTCQPSPNLWFLPTAVGE